jgi:hypothetical protein
LASTDARPVPIRATAYRVIFGIYDNTGSLVSGAAGLDSEVSKDQGTFADCTNEATEIATSSGIYYLDLTSTEMTADCSAIIVKTSTTNAKTTVIVLYPQDTGDIKVDVQSLLGTAWLTPGTAGTPDVNVKLWNALTTVALPLIPTTPGRSLDVSSGGEAGVDWANVGSPTTTNGLTGTTIATSQVVASVTGAVGSVTGAVGSVTGAVGSVTGNVGGNVTGTVASVVGNVGGNVTGSVGSVVGAVGSVTGAVGSVTGNVGGNVVGSVATLTELSSTAQVELSAVPASTATLKDMIKWVFLLSRNKLTQTTTTTLAKANDGSTTVGTSTVSDDGTTATRGVFS